jgi:hypothetical protein
MPKYEGEDHYLYKGTGVLKNKLGLTVATDQFLTAQVEIFQLPPLRLLKTR